MPACTATSALVGTALAQASTRPALPWTFIVLDTDGVNAFAAPGGYVHITRGALALIKNEAELAGVLGARDHPRHREAHHPGDPEEQGRADGRVRDAVRQLRADGDGRHRDLRQHRREAASAARKRTSRTRRAWRWRTGSATRRTGWSAFLTHAEGSQQGLEGEARAVRVASGDAGAARQASRSRSRRRRWPRRPRVQPRYAKNITYKPVPVTAIATVDSGRGRPDRRRREGRREEARREEGRRAEEERGFGLSKMLPTGGGEKKQAQVTGVGRRARSGSREGLEGRQRIPTSCR